jgi:hypothetical protein
MNTVGKKVFGVAILALGIAVAAPAHAQFGSPTGDRGPTNDSFGGNYKDPQQKAADHLAKGLRYKEKAGKESDLNKQRKLLEKAKKELSSSGALHPNHDAYVALGLVEIALGNRNAAMDACWKALGLRRDSPNASACFEQAKAMTVPVDESAPARSGG